MTAILVSPIGIVAAVTEKREFSFLFLFLFFFPFEFGLGLTQPVENRLVR